MLTSMWWQSSSTASDQQSPTPRETANTSINVLSNLSFSAGTDSHLTPGSPPRMPLEEEEEYDIDKLLTQFPPYGSHQLAQGGSGQNDWLKNNPLMGFGSNQASNQTEIARLAVVEETKEDQASSSSHHSAPTTSTANAGPPPLNGNALEQLLGPWDQDEQDLWSTPKTPKPLKIISSETSEDKEGHIPTLTREIRLFQNRESSYSNISYEDTKEDFEHRSFIDDEDGGLDKQHWMPDKLCKQCYACDTQFHVFRRRHHCRLCGQVFCNACSAYFLPRSGSTIRVCKLCYDQVEEKGGLVSSQTVRPGQNSGNAQTSSTERPRSEENASLNANRPLPRPAQSRTAGPEATDGLPRDPNVSLLIRRPDRIQQRITSSDTASTGVLSGNGMPADEERLLQEKIREGNIHLGGVAAEHLEAIARHLLPLHAPMIWKKISPESRTALVNKLLTLATRCCSTVDPNVKRGDLLDIRPYCKVKVIPGGSYRDCVYMSGVMFRKLVSHKKMAKEVLNPRIMLLSGGIEFTRTENRIASLETLFEQEDKYMEILVGKILKFKPDILLVGRSVSRRAQELLLKANVVLIQHVKSSLLNRIARQTGATIISSTDHVMNQIGSGALGQCRRFRLVTFRDNDVWLDDSCRSKNLVSKEELLEKCRLIDVLLADSELSNHERQAALAASQLGQGFVDGTESVRKGLAKRGVAQMFVMLEGCPKHLGCTVVLRGANRNALKQVKVVFRFLVNIAYNLRLELSYLRERGARIRPSFVEQHRNTFSSSLCVDYGDPPNGRVVKPWNGGNQDAYPKLEAGVVSPFDHQSILITSIWMTNTSQCCPAEVKGICYYSLQDVALGQFLRDSCFNLSLKCQNPNCKKSVLDHSLSFVHNDGLINIVVEEMENAIPLSPDEQQKEDGDGSSSSDDEDDEEADHPIATWTYCEQCEKVVTPMNYISENTWKFSFGKFLEVFFYNRDAITIQYDGKCNCPLQTATILYFGCGKLRAKFTYERVRPFGVFVRRNLPLDISFHKNEALRRLELISKASSDVFVSFDKHIEKVSREARSLFNSAVNRPEHLQTVLSALNAIGSEVDRTAKTLQEKIVSVADECRRKQGDMIEEQLFQFPWLARRFLFTMATAWNEKLSASGQAISVMKKIASSASHRSDGVINPNVVSVVGDPLNDDLIKAMNQIQQLNEQYARYNILDMTQALPALPGNSSIVDDPEFDDDFDDPDNSIDFPEGIDADVLASRLRLKNSKGIVNLDKSTAQRARPSKSLGTRRSISEPSKSSQETTSSKSTPGGAVKSALTRLFNRAGKEADTYVVDLGILSEGRPRLPPGINGIVIPVLDEQLSTIIAYSLASPEYSKQFKHFARNEQKVVDLSGTSLDKSQKNPAKRDEPNAGDRLESALGDVVGYSSVSPNSPIVSRMSGNSTSDVRSGIERRMLARNKAHIKHTFRDFDEKGQVTCKFVCTTYWATQFHAVRQVFLSNSVGKLDNQDQGSVNGPDFEQSYIESLSSAYSWAASGGKSGASFARTSDDRFVIKCISRTELQMFLDCAPAYFEYLSKAFFHGLPTVLCKIVGVYQIGVHNRITGKRTMDQVAIMQNIFYNRKISKIFDLKGSLRGRFAAQKDDGSQDPQPNSSDPSHAQKKAKSEATEAKTSQPQQKARIETARQRKTDGPIAKSDRGPGVATLLDGDFLEFTNGRPMPMTDRAKAVFQMSILNDTLFLSIINVLDYSILVGVDEEKMELVVGIIDFMRQYDILKQMERVGKSLPMVMGSEAPTIIQPPLYKARFTNAMERYFMTVPSKWTTI